MIYKYIYCDDKTAKAYSIEDGRIEHDQKLYISDWENMEPFWESSENFKHLILILEKLLERH